MTRITINGQLVETELPHLHYDDVVKLAGMTGNPSVTWKCTNHTGAESSGIMSPSSTPAAIIPSEGLAFRVVHTGNA